ncbi:MAG: hypothetical protein LQ346_001355 [Caloplaca aetnensis]|nr:MAG: hypothetical protein LQ346_001355 [Caloplaca aetnensis]
MTDGPPGGIRRTALSPRPKGRGKSYNSTGIPKRFNVDSPSFTPSSLAVHANGNQSTPKSTGISPKFASAAPFKPKGLVSRPASTAPSNASSSKGYNPNAPEWNIPDAQEFLPQTLNNVPPKSEPNDHNARISTSTKSLEQFSQRKRSAMAPYK